MDYGSRWAEPPAAPTTQHHHHPYYAPQQQHHHPDVIQHQQQTRPPSSAAAYYYPNPNPNPSTHPDPNRYPTPTHDVVPLPSAVGAGAPRPPAADPYVPIPYAHHGGYDGLHTVPYSYPGPVPPPPAAAGAGVGAPSSYYYGGGGENPHSLAVKEAIRQYGVDPHSYEPVIARISNGLEPTALTQTRPSHSHGRAPHPTSKKATKKGPKRTKVLKSAYCEVCKIACNTLEVLKSHKQGRKHKKNLQKLQESITAKPTKAPTTTVEKKETPDAEKNKAAGEKMKTKGAPATAEELETKKRRVLEGGAAAEDVKVCTICNVVVNSQKVYDYHIAGQKHAAMVKKLQEEQQGATATDIAKD